MPTQAGIDCLLIADDLTGACDAAAPFASHGRRTAVLVSPSADAGGASVLAISTESRDLPRSEIRAAMARLAACLPVGQARVVFKKIDSTLRGQPGLEIAAAREIFGCQAAVVCPAFPAMRRIVREGCLRVETALDFAPIHLPTLLSCAHIAPGELRAAVLRGERMVSLDAVCDADLDRIAAEIRTLDAPILWAGSAGLASALARSMPAGDWSPPKPPASGPALFCIGSNHAVTLDQQSAFLAARIPVFVDSDASRKPMLDALARGQHVLLRIPRDRVATNRICECSTGAPAAALVLSGGDTASLVCAALGVERIDLSGEIAPGIARGILRGGAFDGMAVATKSGGFGSRDAMIQIADYFSCPNR